MRNKSNLPRICRIVVILLTVAIIPILAFGLPSGPTVSYIRNSTGQSSAAALINTTGGSITTMILNASTQDVRWKAYVGNVTGTLTLDDANSYSIFDWSVTSVLGEVYATRSSSLPDWSKINCSTKTNISNEEIAMNHTQNPNDNISTTFSQKIHKQFFVGSIKIDANSCQSLHTYVNSSSQNTTFEEILLSDQNNMVYSTLIENSKMGYRPDQKFDFQMILPENGADGWTSSTGYYFYVELT